MRSTFKQLYYINRAKVKADGTTAIMCRITIDGRSTVLATDIFCRPKDWNAKKGEIAIGKDNNRLADLRNRIEALYDEQLRETGVVTPEILKNIITEKTKKPTTLLQMGEWERERLRIRSNKLKKVNTYRHSKCLQAHLQEFLHSLGRKDIPLTEIDETFGLGYKVHLVKGKRLGPSQTNHCLIWLNRLVWLGVDMEILRCNPLENVEYEKKPQSRHRSVNREDFKKLLATPMPDKRMEVMRHWFIFSSLTGLAYVDARGFYPHHIGKTADGRRYIRINRQKTKVESFIPLHPIAEQILDMYNTSDDEKPVFPLPTLNCAWTDIHEMGFAIGRTENLSAHMARHTFGTMLVSEGICLESIAKMMGHSSVKSTQVYAKVTDDNISRDMDRLQKRREEKGLTTNSTTTEHNKALLQKKLNRPKELLREDPRLAVKRIGRPKNNLMYQIPK